VRRGPCATPARRKELSGRDGNTVVSEPLTPASANLLPSCHARVRLGAEGSARVGGCGRMVPAGLQASRLWLVRVPPGYSPCAAAHASGAPAVRSSRRHAHARRGRWTVNVVPRAAEHSTAMRPRWSRRVRARVRSAATNAPKPSCVCRWNRACRALSAARRRQVEPHEGETAGPHGRAPGLARASDPPAAGRALPAPRCTCRGTPATKLS
jgi:hypothetical protein